MSGRWGPSSCVVTCRSKSQRSTMPDRPATFLSVVSPHDPRTCGLRRALTRDAASAARASPASRTDRTWDRISVRIWTRSFSTSVSLAWNSLRLAATGASSCSVACMRCCAEVSTDLRCCSATSWDSSRNCSTIVCRPASISSERATAASRWVRAPATSASVCAALVRASAASVRASAASRARWQLLAGPRSSRPSRLGDAQPPRRRRGRRQGEEHEECGGHGRIVTQTTDRTPDHTPGSPPSPTLRGMAPLVPGRAITLVVAAGAALVLTVSPAFALVTATPTAWTPS